MVFSCWIDCKSTLITSLEDHDWELELELDADFESHATSTRKYKALRNMSSELENLSKKLLDEKLNRGTDRSFGTGIPAFG